jgi:hypothetical protein
MHPGAQRQGGVGVPQIMEPDPTDAGAHSVLLEPVREPLRVDRRPRGRGEYQALVLPAGADRQPIFSLADPPNAMSRTVTKSTASNERRAIGPLPTFGGISP